MKITKKKKKKMNKISEKVPLGNENKKNNFLSLY